MRLTETSGQELLCRLPWWFLFVAVPIITLAFAGIYFGLAVSSPSNGIRDATTHEISFWTCVYFSVVTETTLGDGNISPIGVARAFVSLQVLLGLVLAGIAVAKITSARSSIVARLTAMTEGDWVDCVRSSNGTFVVGRTWIEGSPDGLIFQGTDFHGDGTRAGSFISHSISLSNGKASFAFQAFDFTKKLFSSGVQTIRFSNLVKGRYMRYSIAINDPTTREAFVGFGKRVETLPLKDKLYTRDTCNDGDIRAVRDFFSSEFVPGIGGNQSG
jgi:potassium channel LctB